MPMYGLNSCAQVAILLSNPLLRDNRQPVMLGIHHNLAVVEDLMILVRSFFRLQKQRLIFLCAQKPGLLLGCITDLDGPDGMGGDQSVFAEYLIGGTGQVGLQEEIHPWRVIAGLYHHRYAVYLAQADNF